MAPYGKPVVAASSTMMAPSGCVAAIAAPIVAGSSAPVGRPGRGPGARAASRAPAHRRAPRAPRARRSRRRPRRRARAPEHYRRGRADPRRRDSRRTTRASACRRTASGGRRPSGSRSPAPGSTADAAPPGQARAALQPRDERVAQPAGSRSSPRSRPRAPEPRLAQGAAAEQHGHRRVAGEQLRGTLPARLGQCPRCPRALRRGGRARLVPGAVVGHHQRGAAARWRAVPRRSPRPCRRAAPVAGRLRRAHPARHRRWRATRCRTRAAGRSRRARWRGRRSGSRSGVHARRALCRLAMPFAKPGTQVEQRERGPVPTMRP